MPQMHRGQVFHLAGTPGLSGAVAALTHFPDGGLLVDDAGRISWCGPWSQRPADAREATVVEHAGSVILPGFIDTHLHFPQAGVVDSFGGGQLLEWLDRVVFPAEERFADAAFAQRAAEAFCDHLVSAGTTTSLVFGSEFEPAQEALFDAAARRGLRMVLGRTTMTVGPPSAARLVTGEVDAVRLARDEIERWHPLDGSARGVALQQVAIIPRYALSVTAETLRGLGDLYDEFRDRGVYFTTHLSENNRAGDGEVAATRRAFGVRRYLDVYDGLFLDGSTRGGSSLLGRRSVLAHAVHCEDGELERLAETGSSIAHCPVSQQYLGSGTMPWRRTTESGVNVAIGSDIGAGDEWFIPRVLNAAYKVHMGEPAADATSIHPAELLFTATLAGARALDLEERIGNLDVGKDADFVVLDPGPLLAEGPIDRDALLFGVLMSVRQEQVRGAYVRGRRLDRIAWPDRGDGA